MQATMQLTMQVTLPNKPNSRLQKYRLTPKGLACLSQIHPS